MLKRLSGYFAVCSLLASVLTNSILPTSALAAAPVRTQEVHIINDAGVPQWKINRFEQAGAVQSQELSLYWHTPVVKFSDNGWNMVLTKLLPSQRYKPRYNSPAGYHTVINQKPYMFIKVNVPNVPWTAIAGHELMETLVDPQINNFERGQLVEVCDPLPGWRYRIDGATLVDFILPAWYQPKAAGPYDYLHLLKHAGQSSPLDGAKIVSGQEEPQYYPNPL